MISREIDGFCYYACGRCSEVFFGRQQCLTHEAGCDGTFHEPVYEVYMQLNCADYGIRCGVIKKFKGVEPVTGDAITATVEKNKKLLLYSFDGKLESTKITSSPVLTKDIPKAIKAVQAVFVEKLTDLAKHITEVDRFTEKILNHVKEVKNEATTIREEE